MVNLRKPCGPARRGLARFTEEQRDPDGKGNDLKAFAHHERGRYSRRLGPFALAYLEALVRVADWRASDAPSASIKPEEASRD